MEAFMCDFIAHVEPISSILRVFVNEKGYGEKYLWCCTLRWLNPKKVELCAVTDFPNLAFRRAIGKALWNQGAKELFFTRKFDGKDRTITIDLINAAERENWTSN